MNVLVINTVRLRMNGISSVIMNYFRICKDEIHMDFLVNEYAEEVYRQELRKYRSNIIVVNRKKRIFSYILTLIKLIKNNHYDIIHIHGNSATMAIESLIAKLCGVKVRIVHCHNTECTHKLAHKLLLPVLKKTYTQALACSELAGKWIFGQGNFQILNNGISVEKFLFQEQIRKKVRIQLSLKNKFVIGHVGLMNEQKNHKKLLRIVKEIKQKKPEVHLLCVSGNDSIPEFIEKEIEELGLKNDVTILLKRQDVNELLYAMDFFVFPSKWEGLGMAVIEAEASGLPCLLSDAVPLDVDLTDKVTHYSLKKDDRAWADFICKNTVVDPIIRKEMNESVRKSIFNINHCKDTLLKIYGVFNIEF